MFGEEWQQAAAEQSGRGVVNVKSDCGWMGE